MLQTALVCLYRRTEELIVAKGNLVGDALASVENTSSAAEAWAGQTSSVTESVRVETRVRNNKDAANLLHVINAASYLSSCREGG